MLMLRSQLLLLHDVLLDAEVAGCAGCRRRLRVAGRAAAAACILQVHTHVSTFGLHQFVHFARELAISHNWERGTLAASHRTSAAGT